MNDSKSATTHIFTVLIENIRLFLLQPLRIHTFAFGGYPRHLIARCCAVGCILHFQLDLLLNGSLFLFQLFNLVRKFLPLIQQATDRIQISCFVLVDMKMKNFPRVG